MLPGVELARRRRVHYHGDMAAGDHLHAHAHQHHHHNHQMGAAPAPPLTGVVGPALAARNRLEEKLRGAALPSSRWGRLTREREGRAASRQPNIQPDQQQVLAASTELRVPCRVPASTPTTSGRAEMRRTLSKADLCAVCLDEVRERQQRVTRLPCSHKYHSDCVLPWLAIQPDCPCCRTLVPSVHTLSQTKLVVL